MRFSELGFQWYSVVNTESSEDTRLLVVIWSCVGYCCSTSSIQVERVCVYVYIYVCTYIHMVYVHMTMVGEQGVCCVLLSNPAHT